MTNTYKLTTLRDVYEKVPADKLAICMREIAETMKQAKALEGLMNAAAEELGASAATIWPDECTWEDDGRQDKTIKIHDSQTGEHVFTYEAKKSA